MLLIPAIDLYKGKIVRLYKGKFNKMKEYDFTVFEYLKFLKKNKFKRIHVIDLFGAEKGEIHEIQVLENIKRNFNFEVQFGGGIRNLDIFKKLLGLCDFLIIGTMAFNKDFLEKIVKYKKRVIIALDVYEDDVLVKGWKMKTDISFKDALKYFSNKGFNNFLITDIKRDGTMRGVSRVFLNNLKKIVNDKNLNLFYAGGIRNDSDMEYLKNLKIFKGVVLGKYLLEEAQKCLQKES